ncbi:Na(+)/H(+) antiporter NhaA OS=Streptomyces albaduncus OX=68172 GN=nhaA PE=3 SV=1 [Streptomyces griseoloalbus]
MSLLIGELAFEDDAAMTDSVKAAVLAGSLIATALATVLLKIRNARYRRLADEEERDEDQDGVPDVYEQDDPEYHLRMARIFEKKAAEHRRLAREKAAARDALAQVPGGAGDRHDGPA